MALQKLPEASSSIVADSASAKAPLSSPAPAQKLYVVSKASTSGTTASVGRGSRPSAREGTKPMSSTAAAAQSAPLHFANAALPRCTAYPSASHSTQSGSEYASTRGDSAVSRSPYPEARFRAYASAIPASSLTVEPHSACQSAPAAAAATSATAARPPSLTVVAS